MKKATVVLMIEIVVVMMKTVITLMEILVTILNNENSGYSDGECIKEIEGILKE